MQIVVNARFLTQKITGVQRFAIEISLELKKLLPNIVFLAPKNIIHKELAKKLEAKTIGINTGHLWEQIDLPLYLKSLKKPFLLNLTNTAPLFYKNKIVTIYDISWKHFPNSVSKSFYIYYSFLIPKIAKNSLHIFTVSEFSKKDIATKIGISKEKFTVVYSSINDRFKYLNLKKEKIILSVATLQPYKNMSSLIKAFILLKERYKELKDYKLLLVGGINTKVFRSVPILNNIKSRKDIIFTGYISDDELIKYYNKAQIFVITSKFEGFGIPPLEAMACGTPVVSSNSASLPEICDEAAYYVNPYDVNNIAEGIYKVLMDEKLREELIRKGFKNIKRFSWKRSAKKIIDILTTL